MIWPIFAIWSHSALATSFFDPFSVENFFNLFYNFEVIPVILSYCGHLKPQMFKSQTNQVNFFWSANCFAQGNHQLSPNLSLTSHIIYSIRANKKPFLIKPPLFRSAFRMPTSRSYPRHLVQFCEKRKEKEKAFYLPF